MTLGQSQNWLPYHSPIIYPFHKITYFASSSDLLLASAICSWSFCSSSCSFIMNSLSWKFTKLQNNYSFEILFFFKACLVPVFKYSCDSLKDTHRKGKDLFCESFLNQNRQNLVSELRLPESHFLLLIHLVSWVSLHLFSSVKNMKLNSKFLDVTERSTHKKT